MSKILDTRDLNERLEELKDIKSAFEDAEQDFKAAEDALEICKEEDKEEYQKALDEAQDVLDSTPDLDDDEKKELKELEEMESEIPEWCDGNTLIPESEWVDYCRELCEEIGDLPKDLPWYIESNIDWDGVASDLAADYSTIDYQNETYYYRNC